MGREELGAPSFRMARSLIAVIAFSLIVGCEDSPADATAFDLARARTLWAQSGIADYDFTLDLGCFCGFVGLARIEVRGRTAVSATSLETGEAIQIEALRIRTVDHAFDVIQSFLESEQDRRVEVDFDRRLGYPVSGFLDIFRIADEELRFEITDLEPTG